MNLDLILQRCRTGDELAWEALVREYQSRVYGIAYYYVNEEEEARDLAQDVFVRIYRNIATCPDAHLFVPWMIRICRNACVDHLRRKKARPPLQDLPAAEMRNLRSKGLDPEEQWTTDTKEPAPQGSSKVE